MSTRSGNHDKRSSNSGTRARGIPICVGQASTGLLSRTMEKSDRMSRSPTRHQIEHSNKRLQGSGTVILIHIYYAIFIHYLHILLCSRRNSIVDNLLVHFNFISWRYSRLDRRTRRDSVLLHTCSVKVTQESLIQAMYVHFLCEISFINRMNSTQYLWTWQTMTVALLVVFAFVVIFNQHDANIIQVLNEFHLYASHNHG